MDNKQYKGILMALMSPPGNTMILRDMNLKMMEDNAENIMKRCGVVEPIKENANEKL